jgi:hypothetical protein
VKGFRDQLSFYVNFWQTPCSGSICRFQYHLAHIPSYNIGPCLHVDQDVKHQANLGIDTLNEVKARKARINAEMANLTGGQSSSNTPLIASLY